MDRGKAIRARATARLAAVVAPMACSACSLILGIDDGLPRSAIDDASVENAGTSDGEAGPIGDGGTVSEEAAPADGPAMADARADVDGGGFCASQTGYSLCADFDEGAYDKAWQTHTIMGGTLAADGQAWTSSPSSLLGTLTMGTTKPEALLTTTFAASTAITCDLDLRLDQVDPNGATVAVLGFDEVLPSPKYYHVFLEVGLTSASMIESGDVAGYNGNSLAMAVPAAAAPSPPPAKFSHVTIALDLSAPRLTVKVDGVSQLDTNTLKPSTGSSGITMNLGPNSNDAPLAASWTTRFDNVLCKASP